MSAQTIITSLPNNIHSDCPTIHMYQNTLSANYKLTDSPVCNTFLNDNRFITLLQNTMDYTKKNIFQSYIPFLNKTDYVKEYNFYKNYFTEYIKLVDDIITKLDAIVHDIQQNKNKNKKQHNISLYDTHINNTITILLNYDFKIMHNIDIKNILYSHHNEFLNIFKNDYNKQLYTELIDALHTSYELGLEFESKYKEKLDNSHFNGQTVGYNIELSQFYKDMLTVFSFIVHYMIISKELFMRMSNSERRKYKKIVKKYNNNLNFINLNLGWNIKSINRSIY